jgi:8-oxo-dGTP pyrophosphatase MutT (NUDIX family)
VPAEARPAASVVLVRPGTRAPLEAFLIRRARGMRFLAGYYAFPGGKVDPGDRSPEALARVAGLDAAAAGALLGDPGDPLPALAYWVAAARELFEETGVLLAADEAGEPVRPDRAGPRGRQEAHRRALVRGRRDFPALLAAEGWRIDARPLRYLGCFVTPLASPIRFSARFFLCPLPAGQAPRFIAGEASEGFWVEPAAAYARFLAGEWPMAEPAEYTMRYLAQFESGAALWAHHGAGRPVFDGIIHRAPPDGADLADRADRGAPRAADA